jgi:hypothetical protein
VLACAECFLSPIVLELEVFCLDFEVPSSFLEFVTKSCKLKEPSFDVATGRGYEVETVKGD